MKTEIVRVIVKGYVNNFSFHLKIQNRKKIYEINMIFEYFFTTCSSFLSRSSNLYIYIYAPPLGLSSLAKELPAAASVMQSSSKELSTLVADRVLKNVNKRLLLLFLKKYLKIPLANVVRLVDEWSESQSNVKLDGFLATLKSSDRTTIDDYRWLYIYIYIYIYIYW